MSAFEEAWVLLKAPYAEGPATFYHVRGRETVPKIMQEGLRAGRDWMPNFSGKIVDNKPVMDERPGIFGTDTPEEALAWYHSGNTGTGTRPANLLRVNIPEGQRYWFERYAENHPDWGPNAVYPWWMGEAAGKPIPYSGTPAGNKFLEWDDDLGHEVWSPEASQEAIDLRDVGYLHDKSFNFHPRQKDTVFPSEWVEDLGPIKRTPRKRGEE